MRTAVCVLLEQSGKFLVISRRNDTTRWGLPGGKVDKSEANIDGMIRELYEETGIRGFWEDYEPIYSGYCPGKLAPSRGYWVTTYLWVGGEIDFDKLVPEAGFALSWMTENDLCNSGISPFYEYNIQVFNNYREWKHESF